MSKVRVVKVNKTEFRRSFSEEELDDILRKHVMLEAGKSFDKNTDKSRLYVKSGDNLSGGPYKTFEVTVVREDGESSE